MVEKMPRNPWIRLENREIGRGVYIIMNSHGYIKIGYSSNFRDRLAQHQTSNSHPLIMISVFFTDEKINEMFTQSNYIDYHIGVGEWFLLPQQKLKEVYDMMDKEECILCEKLNKRTMFIFKKWNPKIKG